MKPLIADNCAVPPYSRQENEERAAAFDLSVGKIQDDAQLFHEHGSLALEYVWLTNASQYNLGLTKDQPVDYLKDSGRRLMVVDRLKEYVHDKALDGLMLDCVCDTPANVDPMNGARICTELQNAMPTKIILPNFGSYDAWELTLPKTDRRYEAFRAAKLLMKWHFIQVACHTNVGWESRWEKMRSEIARELKRGRTLVVGINDEVGHNRGLAAAMALAFTQERVYVYYQNRANPELGFHFRNYCYNETLAMLVKP